MSTKDDYNFWQKLIDWLTPGGTDITLVKYNCPAIFYMFPTGGKNVSQFILPAETLRNYIYSYNKSAINDYLPIKNRNISADLFLPNVDDGRKRGYNDCIISADDTFDMLSYSDSHNFWDKLFNGGFKIPKESSFRDVQPIKPLSLTDFVGTNDTISKSLIVASDDVSSLKNAVNSAVAKNETVYLFRFGQTDYYAQDVSAYIDNAINTSIVNSYMAQETVFMDFDIIHLTFERQGVKTIIQAVSSPIDIINEVTPPIKEKVFDWLKILKIILAIILLIILLPLIIKILKLIVTVITIPFQVIGKSIRKNNKKKKVKNE